MRRGKNHAADVPVGDAQSLQDGIAEVFDWLIDIEPLYVSNSLS
jgi:hypothetical protein